MEPAYKGVSIVKIQATPSGVERGQVFGPRKPGREPFLPAVYYAMIEGGFFLSPNEALLRDLIDRTQEKSGDKAQAIAVNSSLYLSPAAAEKTHGLLEKYLEEQVHQQALAGEPAWFALYRAGLIPADGDSKQVQAIADRWLGFVPVSPDGSPYSYDRKAGEVVNARHGSLRRPKTPKTLAEDAPLTKLLEQLRSIRADLRFREDGIHTVLTIDRQQKEK
jgi:hypothetical protein